MTYEERFQGVEALYKESAKAIAKASFLVVGVGGVGSWAAEALVRTGIKNLVLIDPDDIACSNTNRQLQALDGGYGASKVDVLKERFLRINPQLQVTLVKSFVTPENVTSLIPENAIVLDCIDQVKAKAALLACAQKKGCCVFTSGGAGGKRNPQLIRVADLARVKGDPLLSAVRHALRKEYQYPKAEKKPRVFSIAAVYSEEPIVHSEARDDVKLSCAKQTMSFGTSVVVCACMGLNMAALALEAAAKEME